MKLSLCPGSEISDTSRTASILARTHNCKVQFNFNGVPLQATPKKSPVTICWEFQKIISQHCERYYRSPEGKKERARDESEVKVAQKAIDHWMLIVRDMLESGLDNTIGWLSNFLPLANRVGTKVNHSLLISLFEAQGYKAEECTGKGEAFYEVKENLGRYIVGQVLSMWKSTGAVHPHICDFCENYETLRRGQKN